MNRQDKENDVVLDSGFLDAVADSFETEAADEQRVNQLRARVAEKIDGGNNGSSLFDTIRSGEGDWIEILPNVRKKRLKIDREAGMESYLLRLEPSATLPAHEHEADELCYVIEGDLSFGDIYLEAGDYHYARKGSRHGGVNTVNGTLLFLQSGIEFHPTS
ncbi:MAG: cupin domain-containing protein [Gammaproteobacteria bacterium]|nr:cupin domain-containing protein [Gammaproteobacteria bacterium]